MGQIKTIKDVEETTWTDFKSMAAKNDVKLGVFFKTIVNEHKKTSASFWKTIFHEEKILSDKEAEDIERVTKAVRKEYGFRT